MENPKLGKVITVGNSLAIVIPKSILNGLKIERGDRVVFGVFDENQFCVRRVTDEELRKMQPKDLQF